MVVMVVVVPAMAGAIGATLEVVEELMAAAVTIITEGKFTRGLLEGFSQKHVQASSFLEKSI